MSQKLQEPEQLNIKGVTIKYLTLPGVFAKGGLDEGSRLLLETLEVKDNTLIADLGGGSGVISLVLGKLDYNGHVHLLEDHLRSANLAEENIELNRLRNVEVYLSDLFSAVENRTYHLIVSNPPQQMGNEFLLELISESKKHLKPHGELVLVVKSNLKNPLQRMIKDIFDNVEQVAAGRGYVVLKSRNV